jgi:endonuclease/exonuclease/phosphatase family metal-dependent hydrolase
MRRSIGLLMFLAALAIHAPGEELRVMSFNVRYPNPKDGKDIWENRRDLLVATIRLKQADLIGTQELFHMQGEYIVTQAPEYAWFGLSRRGNREDEHMGVFYKKDKLRVIESGNFWLSETPDAAGSMSWDVTLPRMVTWALFELVPSGKRFYYYNTHFAHRAQDEEARKKSADVMLARLAGLPGHVPFLMTGDFNSSADGPVHAKLAAVLKDARAAAPSPRGPVGTFHGFTGTPGSQRIDWIFYRGPWRVTDYEVVTHNDAGRYPSDHFPVYVRLDF